MKTVNIATKFLSLYFLCCMAYPAVVCAATGMPLGSGPQVLNVGPMPASMPAGESPMGESPVGAMMTPQGPTAGQPVVPQQMGGLPMPGGMPSPSATEIEDAFAKVEEIQRTDPALFKQLENAGKEIIMEMAKQDPAQLEAFASSFGLKPEELLAEATKPTTPEPQVDPAVTEAEEFDEEETEAERPMPQKTPMSTPPKMPEAPISSKKPIPIDEGQARRIIAQVTEHIESLRTKMASSPTVYAELRSLELDLLSLALLVAIVDAPVHTARLATGEYESLVKALEKLAAVLVAQEPRVRAFRPSPTPYDLLGVTPQVTPTQLGKIFKALKKQHDPKIIEKELKKKGIEGDDLKRQVKAARITFSEIEEAYDLIKDPITRRDIVDRAIELEIKQQGIDLETSKAAIGEIREALSDALYKDEVISKLEAYLEKYAPEELKLKKAQEKEEKKRLDEQKRRTRLSPVMTPGESFEPTIQLPSGSAPSSYGSYGSPAWYPESTGSRYQPSYPEFGSRQTQDEKDKEREREKDGTTTKEPTLGEKEAKKIDQRTIKQIIGDLDKKFKEFSKAYDDPANQKLLKNLTEKDVQDLHALEKELLDMTQQQTPPKEQESTGAEEKEKSEKPASTETKKAEEGGKLPEQTPLAGNIKTDEEQKKPEKAELAKVKEKEAQDALVRKLGLARDAFQEKQKNFLADAEKLRTNLKLDPVHNELDILSRQVGMLRAQRPTEAQSIAWTKFREGYEKSEVPVETDAKTGQTKAAKPRPSMQEKITKLRKEFKSSTKKVEFETPALEESKAQLFGEISKELNDIPLFIKRIDNWFAQAPAIEKKQTPAAETTKGGTEKKS